MSELRVAYDYQIFQAQAYGGISRYLVEVASHLAAKPGVNVRIAAGLHYSRHLVESKQPFCQGAYLAFNPRIQRLRRYVNRAYAAVALRQYQPSVVHETYYSPFRVTPKGVPMVLTVHDMVHERLPQHFPAKSMDAAWKRAAVARADAVICVSENTRRDLLELLPHECAGKPISVIHHGYRKPVATDAGKAFARTLTGGRPFVLFVGTRESYKNFDTLLRAFSGLGGEQSDWLLVAFGGGPLRDAEREQIQKLGLVGRVLQSSGDDALLGALYEHAQVFVYPSLYEGFGMPILEAFASGCPVICSDIAISREVAGAAAIYFEKDSPESLYAALIKVATAENVHRIAAKERLGFFGWDTSSDAHLRVYSDAAKT